MASTTLIQERSRILMGLRGYRLLLEVKILVLMIQRTFCTLQASIVALTEALRGLLDHKDIIGI